MNKFEECLTEWEKFEQYVAKTLFDKYNLHYTKNPNKFWIDLLWEEWNIEIKLDTTSDETWNYFFEITCKNKLSWIFKYLDMKYYCIWTYDEFYVVERERLIQYLMVFWKRVEWWDNNASVWIVLKKDYIKKIAFYNF